MFRKKMQARSLRSKAKQLEMYQTLYAKAAKERDEALERVKALEEENRRMRKALFLQDCNFEL